MSMGKIIVICLTVIVGLLIVTVGPILGGVWMMNEFFSPFVEIIQQDMRR